MSEGRADPTSHYRRIPSVHQVVERVAGDGRLAGVPRGAIVDAVRKTLADHRATVADGGRLGGVDAPEDLLELVVERVRSEARAGLHPVINGTGIIIHTGLGRAPLADSAAEAAREVAARYAPVEIDLASGARGQRAALVRDVLCELTGAESATVVNNNAAALVLVLGTLAAGRAVVVSRGELIEIGGSFRLPDVIAAGGVTLREVGTTNRTHLGDYEGAVDETAAVLMKVHPSNYRIEGFAESVSIAALAELGHRLGLPVVHDIGSVWRSPGGPGLLPGEPIASISIEAGADLVIFSGDKLLGGPQSGIIVGRRPLIERIERHPMMRAMRIDKIRLAALSATLRLHRDPDAAARDIPVLAMMRATREELDARARHVVARLGSIDTIASIERRETSAQVGGGSLPTETLPSIAVVIVAADSERDVARRLRTGSPPVVPRVKDGAVWIDMRTVLPDQDEELTDAIARAVVCVDPGGLS